MRGRLHALFDLDEHTGGFAGAKAYLDRFPDTAGVFIGYPDPARVNIGARGFYRATLTCYGAGGHSGARRTGVNAIDKASRLIDALREAELPGPASRAFPLPPSLTVTGIDGGGSFTMVPDTCRLMIDVRLTPDFGAEQARALLDTLAVELDRRIPSRARTERVEHETWPAYRLDDASELAGALVRAARRHRGATVVAGVCAPSNIGNLFAAHGIDATCGFGVGAENLHAPDELADLADLASVYRTYRDAASALLGTDADRC